MAKSSKQILILDTTLRDGAQTEGISFTAQDKLKIAHLLDKIGIQYIEGGWPGSNPKDIDFFKRVTKNKMINAKITAFGSTRKASNPAEKDHNLNAMIESEAPVVSIFGKTWDFHVTEALKISLPENLKLIEDSVKLLKAKGREVFFDAEHFFDGYKANPKYAIKCLLAAQKAGADMLVLCDTNGGILPSEIASIIKQVKKQIKTRLGIHAHNDSETAVANSIVAVESGAVMVQGTINGYGERCGNANLSSIIPILQIKMGYHCIPEENLKNITELSRHVAEIANLPQKAHQPFVGRSAFAHKGGIHVSAVLKQAKTYEHLDPELVGNQRHVTISDQSGISNLMYKAKEYGINLPKDSPEVKAVLNQLKELEHNGYQFEEAEASFELLLKKAVHKIEPPFTLEEFTINTIKKGKKAPQVEAQLKIKIKNEIIETKAIGDGPVNALDGALRKGLEEIFPEIKQVKLTDYKVRVLDSKEGTAAKVRVIVESKDDEKIWGTVGVSTNIIEASWQALIDSIHYKLLIK